MTETYDRRRTAVLLVDPYNDFLSEGGKVWPQLEPVAGNVGLLDHLRSVVASARAVGVRVVFVPHRRWEPGDHETWDHPTPSQRNILLRVVTPTDVSEALDGVVSSALAGLSEDEVAAALTAAGVSPPTRLGWWGSWTVPGVGAVSDPRAVRRVRGAG
ncbi:hypothetical protein ACFY0A_17985 [Streptomyces sp. NPDC001698]|uniref:hypothetical protein n=1 Tax=Streptomyces sp. NPDC001698 TaxID=3364601 RepID=UPI00369B5410